MNSKPISPNSDKWNDKQRACIDALSEFSGGYHHLGNLRECGPHGVEMTTFRDFSTFDGDQLTALVISAHARAVRISISACSPSYLLIHAHKRVDDSTMRIYQRHPNLSDLIKRIENRMEIKSEA